MNFENLENLEIKDYDAGTEYGKIGQKKYNGVFFEEFEKRLQGQRAVETYKEMAMNDEIIGSILFAIEMLIKRTEFSVEPAGDLPQDEEARQFIQDCLDDINPGWSATLSEILSFLTYGWAIHEICYKRRNGTNDDPCLSSKFSDGLIGWSKFATRSQDTLYGWVYGEHDDLIGFAQQVPPEYDIRIIPIKKCLHFKTNSNKENPEGKSILRTAYKSYYFKSRIQVIEGIGIERDLAGLPQLIAPEGVDIYNDNNPKNASYRQWALNLITTIRRDECEGILMPPGWKLELTSSGGNRQFDVGSVIERYDKKIAGTVLADFITLGHDGTGSYALANSKTSTFFMAISSYLDIITEVINNQAIPELINLNNSHFTQISGYPKLTHSKIEEIDLTAVADYVTKLIPAGVLTPDPELEKYLRQVGDLPILPDLDDALNTFNINEVANDTAQERSIEESEAELSESAE